MQVLHTFREFEESNILHPYMCDSIKEVSKACQALEVKESAPAIIGILRTYFFATYDLHLF